MASAPGFSAFFSWLPTRPAQPASPAQPRPPPSPQPPAASPALQVPCHLTTGITVPSDRATKAASPPGPTLKLEHLFPQPLRAPLNLVLFSIASFTSSHQPIPSIPSQFTMFAASRIQTRAFSASARNVSDFSRSFPGQPFRPLDPSSVGTPRARFFLLLPIVTCSREPRLTLCLLSSFPRSPSSVPPAVLASPSLFS